MILLVLAMAPHFFDPMFEKPPETLGVPLGSLIMAGGAVWCAIGVAIVGKTSRLALRLLAFLLFIIPATIWFVLGPALILIVQNMTATRASSAGLTPRPSRRHQRSATPRGYGLSPTSQRDQSRRRSTSRKGGHLGMRVIVGAAIALLALGCSSWAHSESWGPQEPSLDGWRGRGRPHPSMRVVRDAR